MAVRIALVEDHKDIRENLELLLKKSDKVSFVGAYLDGEEAVRSISAGTVDVILMDINLPGMSGIACTAKLKAKFPEILVIMLTVYEDSENIFESLRAGASGYLLKRTSPAKLLEAIQEVYNGGSPMSSQIARMVVKSFCKTPPKDDDIKLTARESEILEFLSKGFRYKEIAETLFISIDTVRSHIRKIYEKLHVNSRTEALLKYLHK